MQPHLLLQRVVPSFAFSQHEASFLQQPEVVQWLSPLQQVPPWQQATLTFWEPLGRRAAGSSAQFLMRHCVLATVIQRYPLWSQTRALACFGLGSSE